MATAHLYIYIQKIGPQFVKVKEALYFSIHDTTLGSNIHAKERPEASLHS